MELHEYPRPINDTGIGIHWAPGFAASVGLARIREQWLPELRALGVKWVKVYNHDGALDFTELLLAEGFMPIVRIYRPTPNPGRLSLREIVHVDNYVRAGVRYFEFNNEPDRDSEWKGGRVPANGMELVAEDTIVNMEAILERGGMPGVPAVAVGSAWDIVGKIVAKGRKDLFDGPVWQAVHNHARNRPLDYPFDIGNQEGAALTERFFQALADERWDENAWRGRSLHDVNRLRQDRCAPGATLREDHACWLAFQHYDALNRQHLGRSLPILGTESGYVVGDDYDARYAATTPNLHMAQTLEACRVMMGTSTRYAAAPDYFFCATFTVLANQQLGATSAWWEKHAWFSEKWAGGALPIVRSLRAEPKVARRRLGSAAGAPAVTLRGALLNAREPHTLLLERAGMQVAAVELDANSRYELNDLAPGSYVLRVQGAPVQQAVTLSPDAVELVVNLDLGAGVEVGGRSVVAGAVAGGAGVSVILLRHSDGEEYVTTARPDGAFRFVDLAAGAYSLRLDREGSRADNILLDGRNQAQVELAVSGWGHTVGMADATPGVGALLIRVKGFQHAPIRILGPKGGAGPYYTGTDANLDLDEAVISGLDNGVYILTLSDVTDAGGRLVEPEARVTIDRRYIPLLEFTYAESKPSDERAASTIAGRVIGPLERLGALRVRLLDGHARSRESAVAADGAWRFEQLPAGAYTVEVVGHEAAARRQDLALDGANQIAVDLLLPMAAGARSAAPAPVGPARTGASVIVGRAPGAAGRLARLVDTVGNERRQVVGLDEQVRFDALPAGDYTLVVDGGYEQSDLRVDGSVGQSVNFAPLESAWEVVVNRGESMPGYSVARVEVQGMQGLPVHIWKEGWEGLSRKTGSSAALGAFGLEFSPLGPGVYMIEPEGLGVWTDVELTGLEAVSITFRPRLQPTAANTVLRVASSLLPASRAPLPAPDHLPSPGRAGQAEAEAQRAAAAQAVPAMPAAPVAPQRPYFWIGDASLSSEQLGVVLALAAERNAAAGSDLEMALSADHVTLVGEGPAGAMLARRLREQGVPVAEFEPPSEEELAGAFEEE